MKKHIFFVLFISYFVLLSCYSQSPKKSIFETYKQQYQLGQSTIIPDFSYVGYEYGEKAIPNVNYKIFKVTDFGAIPNDSISDKEAIQACINAAQTNKSGIVFFPKGEYWVNETENREIPIKIKGSHIVLRGEKGSVLFMRNNMSATDPKKMWSTPHLFQFSGNKTKSPKLNVVSDAKVGSFEITLENSSTLKAGDWIELNLQNDDSARIAQEVAPYAVSSTWKEINQKGVMVRNFHQVKSVRNNTLTLVDPIMYPVFASEKWTLSVWNPATQCGIENLHFKGNFKEKFSHHLSALHDGGWSMVQVLGQANSWMKDCVFEDVNNAASIMQSANYSVINCKIIGNGGHGAISAPGSSRVFIGKCIDEASQWHAFGVAKMSINTVIWRCHNPETNCFESHATQPRNTLIDCMVGGFLNTRDGGAIDCLPNHLQGLILWNYTKTNNDSFAKLEFWDSTKPWFKMLMPVIAGFSGPNISFDTTQLKYAEAIGGKTSPESLYEAQLILRLGKLSQWLVDLKR
ncbi:MAG: DUF4955 domain-containing protein [Bacteroidales bacterium]|nr:DUF4955 domain-containing protein [Bacteroidales bacterium]